MEIEKIEDTRNLGYNVGIYKIKYVNNVLSYKEVLEIWRPREDMPRQSRILKRLTIRDGVTKLEGDEPLPKELLTLDSDLIDNLDERVKELFGWLY